MLWINRLEELKKETKRKKKVNLSSVPFKFAVTVQLDVDIIADVPFGTTSLHSTGEDVFFRFSSMNCFIGGAQ